MTLRTLAVAAALVVVATAVPPQPPVATAAPTCEGVWVVVDPEELGAGATQRCAVVSGGDGPITGQQALQRAGHALTFVGSTAFVCRIDGRPATDDCVRTPPGDAYWSYWLADAGGSWRQSSQGVTGTRRQTGQADGWVFGDGSRPPRIAPPAPPPEPAPQPDAPAEQEPTPEPAPEPEAPAEQEPAPGTEADSSPTAGPTPDTGAVDTDDEPMEGSSVPDDDREGGADDESVPTDPHTDGSAPDGQDGSDRSTATDRTTDTDDGQTPGPPAGSGGAADDPDHEADPDADSGPDPRPDDPAQGDADLRALETSADATPVGVVIGGIVLIVLLGLTFAQARRRRPDG